MRPNLTIVLFMLFVSVGLSAQTSPLQIVYKPTPELPENYRMLDIKGTVVLRVEFLASGEVGDVSVVKELPTSNLVQLATDAARKIRFKPATVKGKSVHTTKVIEYAYDYGGWLKQKNEWRGLRPLYSTRSDVENILGDDGKPEYPSLINYLLGNESISVDYAKTTCSEGWDVPVGSVLSIKVSGPQAGLSANEMHLDKGRFFVTNDDALYGTWTDPVAGIQYTFRNIDSFLESIKYIPTRADYKLRCNGFPPFVPEAQYYTREKYRFYDPKRSKTDNLYSTIAEIDNVVIASRNTPGYKGYVLVYFDDKLPLAEYRIRLARVKQMAAKMLKLSPGELTYIEAGMNRENQMEMYILPTDAKPPAPNPELPSPQFMKKASIRRQSR